jgi:hypothetical protein
MSEVVRSEAADGVTPLYYQNVMALERHRLMSAVNVDGTVLVSFHMALRSHSTMEWRHERFLL